MYHQDIVGWQSLNKECSVQSLPRFSKELFNVINHEREVTSGGVLGFLWIEE